MRIRKRPLGRLGILLVVASFLTASNAGASWALSPTPAPPAGFHAYSFGSIGNGRLYSGVSVSRKDLGLAPSGCIYQPEWITDSSAKNWVELGSEYGPGCTGPANSWYYGYATNGAWHLGGTNALTPGQTHLFSVYYYLGYYYYYVDLTHFYTVFDNRFFNEDHAGLESFDSFASVGPFQDSSLQYTASAGSWTHWSSPEGQGLGPSPMCGHFVSVTDWQAGENVGATC